MPLFWSISLALRALYSFSVSSAFLDAVNLGVFVFIPLRNVSRDWTFPGSDWHLNCKTMLLFILWGFVSSSPPDPCWLVHSNVRNDLPPLNPLWKNFCKVFTVQKSLKSQIELYWILYNPFFYTRRASYLYACSYVMDILNRSTATQAGSEVHV